MTARCGCPGFGLSLTERPSSRWLHAGTDNWLIDQNCRLPLVSPIVSRDHARAVILGFRETASPTCSCHMASNTPRCRLNSSGLPSSTMQPSRNTMIRSNEATVDRPRFSEERADPDLG